MGDEYAKKLEELYSKKADLERKSDAGQKLTLARLSSLYLQEIREAEAKEKQIAANVKKYKEAENKMLLDLEKVRIKEEKKLREQHIADTLKELNDAINAQLDLWDKEDAYNEKRELINAQNRYAIKESAAQNEFELKQMQLDNDREAELAAAEETGADILLINEKFANYQKILDKEVAEAKLQLYATFAGSIAALFGEQTAIGRAAAVASTIISTYQAAQAAFASQIIPGDPTSVIRAYIAAAAATLSGMAMVKKIMAVKSGLPGDSGGGPTAITSTPAAQRTFATAMPSSSITQQQLTQSQLNVAPQQQFLTAQDITNALMNLPNPVVTVEDINAKVKSVNKINVRGVI